jgi:hypothetical protein
MGIHVKILTISLPESWPEMAENVEGADDAHRHAAPSSIEAEASFV